jgi:hypothetical protein
VRLLFLAGRGNCNPSQPVRCDITREPKIFILEKKKEKGKSEMRRKIAHKSKSSPAVI